MERVEHSPRIIVSDMPPSTHTSNCCAQKISDCFWTVINAFIAVITCPLKCIWEVLKAIAESNVNMRPAHTYVPAARHTYHAPTFQASPLFVEQPIVVRESRPLVRGVIPTRPEVVVDTSGQAHLAVGSRSDERSFAPTPTYAVRVSHDDPAVIRTPSGLATHHAVRISHDDEAPVLRTSGGLATHHAVRISHDDQTSVLRGSSQFPQLAGGGHGPALTVTRDGQLHQAVGSRRD